MTLIKWPKETQGSRNQSVFPTINDLLGDLIDGVTTTNETRKWSNPAVNISENEKSYKLQMAAPGLKKEDFKISVQDAILTVSADSKKESTEKVENYTRKEFYFETFKRSFNLPETITIEGISANYENGIMQIVLPKQEPVKPKTLEINIA